MAAYNTSSAYKLDTYEDVTAKRREQLKLVRSRKSRLIWSIVNIRSVSTFLLVIAVMGLIVHNQILLNEITGDINQVNSIIKEMENENVRLLSTLESTVSLHDIAERAQQELGMQKLDKYQIEYVSLYKDNKIVITEEAPKESFATKLSLMINSTLRQVKEYIGVS